MKTRTVACIFVIIILRLCVQFGIADDFDWPRWRGPNGDGISMETDWNPLALKGGPKILWNVDVGMGHSNVAIKDNHLYTMGRVGRDNVVFCLDADTGKEIWRHLFESSYEPQSTPTVDGKYVYALSGQGILLCLKTKNGKVQWTKYLIKDFESPPARFGFATSPVIEGDIVILNANTCIALNKKTGDKVWITEMHEKALYTDYYATPVLHELDGRRCALIFSGRGLFSVNILTGEKVWYYEWKIGGQPNSVDPVVVDNKVFISSCSYSRGDGVCLEIKENEPQIIWQNKEMGNVVSTCLLINGYMYGCDGWSGCTRLRCLDFTTGDVMWDKEMQVASFISAGGKFIILEDDGTLHIAEVTPASYKEMSSCDVLDGEKKPRTFWTPPVLCNGKIYCRNNYGDLVCIDVSK